LVTLGLAVTGAGVWSLVAGVITLHTVKAIVYNVAYRRFFVPLFSLGGSGRLFKYGMNTTGERLVNFVFTESDTVIVGRFLGPSNLGIYSVALSLASTPVSKVLPIVTQVSFTSYARIQDDPGRVQRNVLRAARVIALLGFPVSFGMAAVAPAAIPLLLGERWRVAVIPFQLLCLVLPLKALWPLLSPAVSAVGRPGVNFSTMGVMAASMIIAMLVGVREGLIGVCVTWLAIYPIVFAITTSRRLRAVGVRVGDYFAELRFPFVASSIMLASIYLLGRVVRVTNPFYSLIGIVVIGVVVYGSLVLIFKRRDYTELRSLLR
jgi:teichuronic acid exporter